MRARLIAVALGATALSIDATAQIARDGAQTPDSRCDAPADTVSAIRETQARLDEVLLRFGDKHPDAIAARRTLEELEKRRQAEIAAARLCRVGADHRKKTGVLSR